jgi:hypothetical protein
VDGWAKAGNIIGNSRRLQLLGLNTREIMNPADVKSFFAGLALNRSIQALKIDLDFSYDGIQDEINSFVKQLFEALLPFFQFNNNLQFFDLAMCDLYNSVNVNLFPSDVNDMILACTSLKSILLHCKMDWDILTGSALTNTQLQHISLTIRGFLVEKLVPISRTCSQISSVH